MQNCSKCSTELNESNAYKKGNRYQSLCKSCFTDYVSQRWVKRKLEAVQSKGGKCQCCGYDKYHGALEFHHLDPKGNIQYIEKGLLSQFLKNPSLMADVLSGV